MITIDISLSVLLRINLEYINMPRPVKVRRVCGEPKYTRFIPAGTEKSVDVILTIEEYEVIRHVDYQKMTHEDCAIHMAISRTTVTEIYESARYKIADAMINGKNLCIEGGNYRVCEGNEACGLKDSNCSNFSGAGDRSDY